MEAIINKITFLKETESKFGMMYNFKIEYDNKSAYYTAKKKEQTAFKEGEKAEFTEETKEGKNGNFLIIKPITKTNFSGFNKALKKEQSKYSGFACSYAKDLVVAGKIDIKEITKYTESFFNLMVKLDKTLEA